MKDTPPKSSVAIILLLMGVIVAIVMYGFVKQVRNGSYCIPEMNKAGQTTDCPGKRDK